MTSAARPAVSFFGPTRRENSRPGPAGRGRILSSLSYYDRFTDKCFERLMVQDRKSAIGSVACLFRKNDRFTLCHCSISGTAAKRAPTAGREALTTLLRAALTHMATRIEPLRSVYDSFAASSVPSVKNRMRASTSASPRCAFSSGESASARSSSSLDQLRAGRTDGKQTQNFFNNRRREYSRHNFCCEKQ